VWSLQGKQAAELRDRLLSSIANTICRAAGHPFRAALNFDYRPPNVI
jgi:hypothetical protein